MKIKKRHKPISFFIGILLLCILIFIIAIAIPIPTTFNVSVTTERIEFKTTDENNSRIPLNNVYVYNYEGDSLGKYNGTFHISEGSKVIAERISNGALTIQVENEAKKSSGILYDTQDKIINEADSFIEFYIPKPSERAIKGENIIIPFSGDVVLGRAVNYESYAYNPALVRNGKITMIGKSLFANHFFESGTYDLNIGDQFVIEQAKSKAYGFVVVNENPAMSAAYRVVGKKGRIVTPGPVNEETGYFISTTFLSRFLYDSFFQSLSWAFACIIFISTALTFIKDSEELISKRKKKK